MEEQLTGPGMQHAGDAKLGAEPAWIAPELEQRFRRAGKEQIEEERPVGECQRTQLGRQSKDDMEGVGRQDTLHAALEPASLCEALTFGAVAITA